MSYTLAIHFGPHRFWPVAGFLMGNEPHPRATVPLQSHYEGHTVHIRLAAFKRSQTTPQWQTIQNSKCQMLLKVLL